MAILDQVNRKIEIMNGPLTNKLIDSVSVRKRFSMVQLMLFIVKELAHRNPTSIILDSLKLLLSKKLLKISSQLHRICLVSQKIWDKESQMCRMVMLLVLKPLEVIPGMLLNAYMENLVKESLILIMTSVNVTNQVQEIL
jgi:hypothetical protein